MNKMCLPFLILAAPSWSQALAQTSELTPWEVLRPDEEGEANRIAEEVKQQIRSTYLDKGKRAFRDAHPRGTGCVQAKFKVEPELDKRYQTGVFAKPGKTYDTIMRFSAALGPAGENTNDARGLAIKLLGVSGTKLVSDEPEAMTHDFIMINAPTFVSATARDFGGIIKIASDPKNIGPFLKESPISRALQLKALIDMTKFNPLNGKSLLAHQFFSQVPYLFKSESINSPVKFTVRPCTSIDRKLDGSENQLRNDLQGYLQEQDACFEFAYQFYKEGVKGIEVENPTNLWQESQFPFIKFASITIPKQRFVSDEKLRYCDNLSFEPWRALEAHRPLGNINRARRIIYNKLSEFRHELNKESANNKEPRDLSAWNALKSSEYTDWREVTFPAR